MSHAAEKETSRERLACARCTVMIIVQGELQGTRIEGTV